MSQQVALPWLVRPLASHAVADTAALLPSSPPAERSSTCQGPPASTQQRPPTHPPTHTPTHHAPSTHLLDQADLAVRLGEGDAHEGVPLLHALLADHAAGLLHLPRHHLGRAAPVHAGAEVQRAASQPAVSNQEAVVCQERTMEQWKFEGACRQKKAAVPCAGCAAAAAAAALSAPAARLPLTCRRPSCSPRACRCPCPAPHPAPSRPTRCPARAACPPGRSAQL